jgi:CHAT domain-containing protein/tetratricopeptide (TPR) repeat protein
VSVLNKLLGAVGLAIVVCCQSLSQPPAKSETALRADRELAEAERLYTAASDASHSSTPEVTSANFRKALERFGEARKSFLAIGDPRNEAICLSWMGRMQEFTGDRKAAVESYSAALAIYQALGDTLQVGNQYANIGLSFFSAKDYNQAIRYYNEALSAARSAKNSGLESHALSCLGQCYSALFNRPLAIEYWEKAVKVDEAAGEISKQAYNLELLAGAYLGSGERESALAAYGKALAIYRRQSGTTARHLESYVLNNMGGVYGDLGDNRKAIEVRLEALGIQRQLGSTSAEASTLERIAIAYSNLKEPKTAVIFLEQALAAYKNVADHAGEASVLGTLSSVYLFNLNDPPKAREYSEQSLGVARAGGVAESEAEALIALGNVYAYLPEGRSKGIDFKLEALRIYRSLDDRPNAADALRDVAIDYSILGKDQTAVAYLDEALLTYAELGLVTRLPETLDWLETCWSAIGNPSFATAYGKQAVMSLQDMRQQIAGMDQAARRTYLRSIEKDYRSTVALLLDQARMMEAHEILTSFKDEQFFDLVDDPTKTQVKKPTLTVNESKFWSEYVSNLAEIKNLGLKIAKLKENLASGHSAPEGGEISRLENSKAALTKKMLDWLRASADEFAKPANASNEVSEMPGGETVWAALVEAKKNSGEEVAAVYQLVTDDGIYSLIVKREVISYVYTPAKGIDELAKKYWAVLQSEKYDPRPLGKQLYDVVFKPIEKSLPPGAKTILWSLDGNLRYVPMAALYDGKQYLVERYNNVTFTRTDNGRLTRAVSPTWNASAFGSSKPHAVYLLGNHVSFGALPGVKAELNTLFAGAGARHVITGDILLDDAFTRENMLARLKQKRPVVHIASHFSFRPGDDARSFLLLGDGTAFTLGDMKRQKDMFAGVELLTLSACNTAAQQPDADGREVDAFFELAQRLGAQSVMATLWPVADNSTPWLMREFYDLKVNKKENKAEALRNAQLALLNGSAKAARSAARSDASQVKIVVEADTASGTTPSPRRGGDFSSEQKGTAAPTPAGTRRDLNKTATRADTFTIAKKDAKPFVPDPKRPFAHPFYWSPFVLIGNWR